MTSINLGCGSTTLDGRVNVDCIAGRGIDLIFDLAQIPERRLPIPENSVDRILMSHVLEHLPNPLALMEELWRIAKHGAEIMIRVPHGGNDDAWLDPTHVRAYFPRSFNYFSQPKYYNFDYGYRADWKCDLIVICSPYFEQYKSDIRSLLAKIDRERNVATELIAYLTAVKPARPRRKEAMAPISVVAKTTVASGYLGQEFFAQQ